MVLLKTMIFVTGRNGEVALQPATGENIRYVLPLNFQLDNNDFNPPPLLGLQCTSTGAVARDFHTLFTTAHLQMIHSNYFGPRGVTKATLDKHPFHSAFSKKLPRTTPKAFGLDTYIMEMALSKYMTNFKNMWSTKSRFVKHLNRLINA